MSTGNPSAPDELLLRDLVGGLTISGSNPTLSVGIVGSAAPAPQPPAHCLRACLGGDPKAIAGRGCAFLKAAAAGSIDLTGLPHGCCSKGFQVAAQAATFGGESGVLISVAGAAQTPDVLVPAGGADLLAHLEGASRLVQRVNRLWEENAGFANEVLQNYEQLNLLFDLIQNIARVTDTQAIERLLLERTAGVLSAELLCVVTPDGECRRYRMATGEDGDWGGAFDAAAAETVLDFVRRTRQVHVGVHGPWKLIAGPLTRLDDQVDVVVALCPGHRPEFKSGDLMLVETIMSFGGQIITNTELHERMRRMSMEVTRALVSAIDKKDHYTSGHSERGGFLTLLTARELGVPPEEQRIMEWAGLLHDIGKIGIPEEILCKPGKLTEAEFDVVKRHPRMGYEILKPIACFNVILDGVLYHHEYPDGSGYPEGLKGEAIPLVARIIHVVDTFDALTSTRSYRRAFSLEKAFSIIREERGVRIDGAAADAFFKAFERYRREQPADMAVRFAHVQEREAVHEQS